MFADTSAPLPPGWDMRMDANAQVGMCGTCVCAPCAHQTLFIDHSARRTTYIDPRLPTSPPITVRSHGPRARSAPANGDHRAEVASDDDDDDERNASGQSHSIDYHERVVQFLRRVDVIERLSQRVPSMAQDQRLRRKLEVSVCDRVWA
jgi:hypothetical protein